MRGPEVRFRLTQTIDELDREARELRSSRQLATTKMGSLAEERERLFRALSEVYLPELGREAVDSLDKRLPTVHRRLDAVLRAKHDEVRQLDDDRDGGVARRAAAIERLDALTEQIESVAVERDRLTERVSASLAADPRHAELVREVEQAEVRREQAQRRYDASVIERDEKVPEYENDPLFGYLLRRGYDTPEYNPSRWTRRLDGWVAAKVSFDRQFESYRLLCELPAVAKTALEELDRAYEQAARRVAGLEESIEDLHGLTQVVERGAALYEQRKALVAEIAEIDEAIEAATARLAALESNRGTYYQQARDALGEFLESRPIPQLREMALSTDTRKDDRLADELERWENDWATVQIRIGNIEDQERRVAARLDALRKIDNRFRGKDFDASNSTFAQSFDFNRLLERFLAGTVGMSKLWDAIVSGQRFEATTYQKAAPIIEAILWEVVRQSAGGGWGGFGRRGGRRGGGRRGGGRTTGGFGGFGGGSRTTGGFG